MIKYRLACGNCNQTFDSWFASSKEYEKLKKKNFLTCHICNSQEVEKTLMAPKLIHGKNKQKNHLDLEKINYIKKTIRGYQKFIKNNFEYVGKNFAYEARTIHYDKKKNTKGIYGTASEKDIQELNEEGIETQLVPWLQDNDN
tara:strand:- start:458 stop:886 length:429 start_codon:yes stop_codon:yes gene_type:complete